MAKKQHPQLGAKSSFLWKSRKERNQYSSKAGTTKEQVKKSSGHQIKPESASKEFHSCLGLQEKPLRKNKE